MNLTEYFEYHLQLRVARCENCKTKIRLGKNNIAHIIPKAIFKSVATNPNNFMYLCHGCHDLYDSSFDKASRMVVFPLAKKRYLKFKKEIQESNDIIEYFEQT